MPADVQADMVIAARGVTLSLGAASSRTAILKGIDVDIARGTSVALLGPSGSGKSSLMAVLSGLERADAGKVEVAGLDFPASTRMRWHGRGAGGSASCYRPSTCCQRWTALENVAVPMELARSADPFDRAAAELTAVGLAHRLGHYPAQLSGGEQQRVAIARALGPRPALVFADEPTGNLDTQTGAAIMDLLFARRVAAGATLVVITHDAALAARCDRILEMADGNIVADRAPAIRT